MYVYVTGFLSLSRDPKLGNPTKKKCPISGRIVMRTEVHREVGASVSKVKHCKTLPSILTHLDRLRPYSAAQALKQCLKKVSVNSSKQMWRCGRHSCVFHFALGGYPCFMSFWFQDIHRTWSTSWISWDLIEESYRAQLKALLLTAISTKWNNVSQRMLLWLADVRRQHLS